MNTIEKKQEPLPMVMEKDGLQYALNPETETYHLIIEEQTLGRYGQMLKEGLLTQNPAKVGSLMATQSLWSFLEEQNRRLEEMYEHLTQRERQGTPEPENYHERARWLSQIEQTANELVLKELEALIF